MKKVKEPKKPEIKYGRLSEEEIIESAHQVRKSLPKSCNCLETSCANNCEKLHTHKTFFCPKCKPETYQIKLEIDRKQYYFFVLIVGITIGILIAHPFIMEAVNNIK